MYDCGEESSREQTEMSVRTGLAGLASLLMLIACQTNVGRQVAIPGTSSIVEVQSVSLRSTYLDVVLVGDRFTGRLFFLSSEECRRLLVLDTHVSYRRTGPWGEVNDADGHCEAIGIGALAHWRDQNPKQRKLQRARRTARFQVVFTDEEYALARGRFPLAAAIYWPVSDDTIAVIPRSEACSEPLERGEALMEYRANGPEALVLISSLGTCAIEGFVIPSPGA